MIITKCILIVAVAYSANAIPLIANVLQRTPEEASNVDTTDPFSNTGFDQISGVGIPIPERVQFALAQQKPLVAGPGEVSVGTNFDENVFERVKYALVTGDNRAKIVFDKPIVTIRAIEVAIPTEDEYLKLLQDASGTSKTISKPPAKYLPTDDGYQYPEPK